MPSVKIFLSIGSVRDKFIPEIKRMEIATFAAHITGIANIKFLNFDILLLLTSLISS